MSMILRIAYALFVLLPTCNIMAYEIYDVMINNQKERLCEQRKDYSHEKIQELVMWEYDTVRGYDFSHCIIEKAWFDGLSEVCDCSFAHSWILSGKVTVWRGCDFTETWFGPKCQVNISAENLVQTRNFQTKRLDFDLFHTSIRDVDFSSFDISNQFNADDIEGAVFNDTYFHDVLIWNINREQLRQTRNYQKGFFYEIKFMPSETPQQPFQNLDISRKSFVNCSFGELSMAGTVMEDTIFINSYFLWARDLTLDQIKQTWNYKTGRMDLIALPPELQKQVDAELAKEGRKPATE